MRERKWGKPSSGNIIAENFLTNQRKIAAQIKESKWFQTKYMQTELHTVIKMAKTNERWELLKATREG